jgi:hypothetical protein
VLRRSPAQDVDTGEAPGANPRLKRSAPPTFIDRARKGPEMHAFKTIRGYVRYLATSLNAVAYLISFN